MKNILLVLFFIVSASFARAESGKREVVYWYVTDFSPYIIFSGPEQGKGIFDQVMQSLFKGAPEYRHEIVEAPLKRILDMIRTRPDACTALLLKTPEREAFMEFSTPFLALTPNGIITTRKRLTLFKPYLNEYGELRLEDFLGNGKFRLGFKFERSFGVGIDTILKKYPQSLMDITSNVTMSNQLLKLANQNEFDGIVGYAIELRQTLRELKLNEKDYVFLPMAESSTLLPVYVACSKSESGKRIIAGANRLFADQKVQREISASYRAWLDDETAAHYDRLLKQSRSGK